MADLDQLVGAITFSDGINAGLPVDEDAPPAADPAPTPEPDAPPVEHNDITDTPVNVPTPPKTRKTKLHGSLVQVYSMAGMMLAAVDPQTAAVILENADACATSLDQLAQKDPRVRQALESLLATSAWGTVIAAHLPIVVTVATKYVPELRNRYKATVADRDAA